MKNKEKIVKEILQKPILSKREIERIRISIGQQTESYRSLLYDLFMAQMEIKILRKLNILPKSEYVKFYQKFVDEVESPIAKEVFDFKRYQKEINEELNSLIHPI